MARPRLCLLETNENSVGMSLHFFRRHLTMSVLYRYASAILL